MFCNQEKERMTKNENQGNVLYKEIKRIKKWSSNSETHMGDKPSDFIQMLFNLWYFGD